MDTIPSLEHDYLWRLLPTISDCNLVRVDCTHYKAPDSIWLNSSARKDKAPAKGTAGTLSQIV